MTVMRTTRLKGDGSQQISNGMVFIDGEWRSVKNDGLLQLETGRWVISGSDEHNAYLHRLAQRAAEADQRKALMVEAREINRPKKDADNFASYVADGADLYLGVREYDGGYAFAYLDDGTLALVDQVLKDGNTIKPRPLPVVEGSPLEIVGLPSEGILQAPSLQPGQLFMLVHDHVSRYVDLAPLDLELSVYYILFSHFYLKCNTVPYLRFLSDTGKGKTRAEKVIGDLCFYPVRAAGASSFSGMARTQERWRGTLVIDEADFSGEKDSQMTKYLNLGFEQGQYYILSDKLNPKNQDYFNPFCPKVIAMREPFSDNATEGRLLSITMHERRREDIPIILPEEYPSQTQRLRDILARFVLEHWRHFDGTKMLNFGDLNIEPRLQQLAMPLSVIFQLLPDGVERFREYLCGRQREIKRVRAISWVGSLVNAAVSMGKGDLEPGDEFGELYNPTLKVVQAITPSMIAKQFHSTGKKVTQTLSSAGFQVEKRWITKVDGKTKKQIRAYAVPDSDTWAEIVRRYIIEDEDGAEIPEALKSALWVKPSQPSQVPQDSDPVTDETDVTLPHTGNGSVEV